MKSLLIILCIIINYCAEGQDLKSLCINKIINNQNIDLDNLKFKENQQQEILDVLKNYKNDTVLILHLNKICHFIIGTFHTSLFQQIRNDAMCLLFEIYRFGISDGGNWIKYYNPNDFNKDVRKKILDIIENKSYSDEERQIIYKHEYELQKNAIQRDSLLKRKIQSNNISCSILLEDSIASSRARFISTNVNSNRAITSGIILLSGWLFMYDAIKPLEKIIESGKYPIECKYALTRLGIRSFHDELSKELNNVSLSWCDLMYLQLPITFDIFINYIKKNNSKYSVMSKEHVVELFIPEICLFVKEFKNNNGMIMNFPYDFSNVVFDCQITNKTRKEIIKWIKDNSNFIQFDSSYYCLTTPLLYFK